MQNDTRIAVDLAKAVFEIALSDRPGKVARRERLPRAHFLTFVAQHPAANIVMEACGSAHYWGRRIELLGHQVTLLPPHQVRPCVRRKHDRSHGRQRHPRGQPRRRHPPGPGQWPSR
jgi:transposase